MKTKTYKIRERYFDAIVSGQKTFEIRRIDSELLQATQLKLTVESNGIGKPKKALTCDIGFIFPLAEAQDLFNDDQLIGIGQYVVISLLNVKQEEEK